MKVPQLVWHHGARIKFLLDLGAWAVAIPLAFAARTEQPPEFWLQDAAALFLVAWPTVVFASISMGLARQSWGHIGLKDLERLAAAVALTTLVLFLLASILQGRTQFSIPRSVPLLAGLFAAAFASGARLILRIGREGNTFRRPAGTRTIVVGTNDDGVLLARELQKRGDADLLGFIDDNPLHRGLSYVGAPVLGSSAQLSEILRKHDAEEVVIALPSDDARRRRIVTICQEANVRYRDGIGFESLLLGAVKPGAEALPELLQRQVVDLESDGVWGLVHGKTVLVTGAGGSIGSEITRQVARHKPKLLVLLAHEENSLFELDQELKSEGILDARTMVVASVRDLPRLEHVFDRYKPDVVFHAAAHKHVPLMEHQPREAILNNVLGTQNMAQMCLHHGTGHFVNISTDKAVRPTNVMGASKRVAEIVTSLAAQHAKEGQSFVSVRFGNVLGSRGSVIPTWLKQIDSGGPVTVTDPEMTRYFMLIPEAVQLVLQAAVLGGRDRIYVLDMGNPVKMVNVAKQLIRMHGLVPDQDIKIDFTGIRPGEKMYEELLIDGDNQDPSGHPQIFVETDGAAKPGSVEASIEALLSAAEKHDDLAIRSTLAELTGLTTGHA